MVAQTQLPATRKSALASAFARASKERLVVFRLGARTLGVASVADGLWTVRPYTLTFTGPGCQDLYCDCQAGSFDTICKHVAVGIFARRYGVFARPPVRS